LRAGVNQLTNLEMLIFERLSKLHASILLEKYCVENKNP